MSLKFSGHIDMLLGDMGPAEKIGKFAELGYPGMEFFPDGDSQAVIEDFRDLFIQ